jgi:uncharacterized protein
MSLFKISCYNPDTLEERVINYDSSNSKLTWDDGTNIIPPEMLKQPKTNPVAKIQKGKHDLKKIKIQLGLSCNFECDYCSQRFVPHADSTNPSDVEPFVNNMSSWFDGGDDELGKGTHFEFWGGEPFVYWKTFKPLAEQINKKYPNSTFSVITNGSMFDDEKIEWLYKYNFGIGISHDGPGQPVRGPDPLEDKQSNEAIIKLFKIFAPEGKVSFNSMVNNSNTSRENIENFFVNWVTNNVGEEYLKYLNIGEGTFVDAYDEGGEQNSLLDEEQDLKFRNNSLNELRGGKVKRFITINEKVNNFIQTFLNQTKLESVGQKCGMDRHDNIAVDLKGNVLTCQNVSAISKNPSNIPHLIGNIKNLESVDVKTATHFSDREECPKCPVVHLCKGACMFLTNDLWETTCNNSFSDNIVLFNIAIEEITGFIPQYIDGPLREDRKDIFWWVNGKPEKTRKAKKVIPIMAV